METKPNERHFLNQYKGEKRKEIRKKIKHSIELRKQQKEWFNKHFIEPQKKVIDIGIEVLKFQKPIELYIRENERLSKHLKDVLKASKVYTDE